MERRQRAEALARLLQATQQTAMPGVFGLDTGRHAELEWGVSTFIARLLALSTPAADLQSLAFFQLTPPQREALASLKERLLIAEVYGRDALTTQARLVVSGNASTSLSPTELAVLRALAEVPEPERWVSREHAALAHTSHAVAYPRTPDLTKLAELGVLRPRDPEGFVVTFNGRYDDRWREPSARAAAIFWETGKGAEQSDVQWLRDWLDRVAMTHWSDAPAVMSQDGRARFLDAARDAILYEPDLQCSWQREAERLRMEQSDSAQAMTFELSATESATPLARYRQYKRRFRRWISHHGGREEITELIGAVIRHDDGAGAHPCARIQALIRGSDQRPFLVYWVPFALSARPAALAWCFTHDDLAAFAAALILDFDMAEETSWIGGEERTERQLEQRITLWDLAMRVLLSEVTSARVESLATALVEVLHTVADTVMARRLLDNRHAAVERRGLETILDHTWKAIQSARFTHQESWGPGLVSSRPHVLAHLARPLFSQLTNATEHEKPDHANFPYATMGLLVRLREVVHDVRHSAPATRDIPTDREIASSIVARYRSEIDRELVESGIHVSPVTYTDDQPDLARLPWGVLAHALYGTPEFDQLLHPVVFQDRIRQIPSAAARVTTATRFRPADADLTQAWANKLRLHLRVLLAAHAQLQQPAAPAMLIDAIEVEIHEILVTHIRDDVVAGTLKLFHRLNAFGAHTTTLAVATAEALNRFTPVRRAAVYGSWIDEHERGC